MARLAVNTAVDSEFLRIPDKLGANQPRAYRHEPVRGFPNHELRCLPIAKLQVTSSEVIARGVAKDVAQRVCFVHVARGLADDDLQFYFVIELRRDLGWELDGPTMARERVVLLIEKDRSLGDGRPDFHRMPAIVEAKNDDFLGPRQAGAKAGVLLLDEGVL